MAVMRVHKNANYTTMSNYHFKEREMSLKAKGLLSLMLSLPDNWDYSIKGLATLSKDGKDSVMSALKELEQFGYLQRERIINEQGHFKGYEYNIFECPQNMEPKSENPKTVEPKADKPQQLNTKQLNTDELKKDKIDKRAKPSYLTQMLIDNNYIDENEVFIDMYNYLLDDLEETYGLEVMRSCIWYLCKQAKNRDITNKFAYCQTALQDGATKISGVRTNALPDSIYNWLEN